VILLQGLLEEIDAPINVLNVLLTAQGVPAF